MTNFVFPIRYSADDASDGVWTEIIDEHDNVWGRFKLALYEQTTPRFAAVQERLARKYPRAKNGKANPKFAAKSALEQRVELLIEMAVVDWDLKDAKGKAVPFSKEAAFDYFTHPAAKYALEGVEEFAGNVLNFQPAEQTEAPEKN